MKGVKKYTERGKTVFRFRETEEPIITAENEVKIKTAAIGICMSDIHAYHGIMHIPDGNIVGHEFSGSIVDVGDKVEGFSKGDRVVCELAINKCGICAMCRNGLYEFCERKKPQGWSSPGVYSEYSVAPYDLLHHVPEGVSMEVAALSEPVAICVYGCIERAGVDKEESVVIYGMGSIGLLTLIMLLDAGFKNVVCVTPIRKGRKRFDLAAELGATRVITPGENIEDVLLRQTGKKKADCVIECSGSPNAINDGLGLLRKDGKFVALGIASSETIPFAFNVGVLNAIRLTFSCTSSHKAWKKTIGILKRQHARIGRIITQRIRLESWEEAYQKLESREAIKIVLIP